MSSEKDEQDQQKDHTIEESPKSTLSGGTKAKLKPYIRAAVATVPTHSASHTGRESGEGPADHATARAGELIISHARADLAAAELVGRIANRTIHDVEYSQSMDEKARFENRTNGPEFQLHLVRVPEGQESWKANYLQFLYTQVLVDHLQRGRVPIDFAAALGRSDLHFIVQPNHLVSLNAAPALTPLPTVSARQFQFSQFHEQYKSMLRIPAKETPNGQVTIAVLDTGVAADFIPKPRQTNLVDENQQDAIDQHGHGTVICSIINDVAPFATLQVFKVFDANGIATEWHLEQALWELDDANIVNLSVGFGLGEVACSECGRKSGLNYPLVYSHRVRSKVLEHHIQHLVNREERILVAAAGNRGAAELDFPARFFEVIAVNSVTSRCQRSSFSNYESPGEQHPNHFAFPGGETKKPEEYICAFGTDTTNSAGTSQATAYASSLLAYCWNRAKPEERNARGMLAAIHKAADKNVGMFARYNAAEHGHGIPRL